MLRSSAERASVLIKVFNISESISNSDRLHEVGVFLGLAGVGLLGEL
jgi:hypothetical protein